MKILHTADWHVGRAIRGRSRSDEHQAVLAEMAEIAASRDVDLVLVAGDIFDTASPSPESEGIAYRALIELADVAPVVMVSGNHDNPRRFGALEPLLRLGRIRVGATLARPDDGGVVNDLTNLPVRIALVPFVSQRGIVRADDLMSLEAAEHGGQYSERMRMVMDHLCRSMTADTVNIVIAHLMVHGGMLGGGERSAHTVFEYSVPSGAFPGDISYVALGHLHRQQRIPAPAPVWYSGSPLQLDFGEAGERKGVLLVDAEPGQPVAIEQVGLSSGKPLVTLTGSLDEVIEMATTVGEAHVRVELDELARAGLADEVRKAIPHVVDVVLVSERRLSVKDGETPARLGRDPIELFSEYLSQTGVDDPRLVKLFSELMEAAHEA